MKRNNLRIISVFLTLIFILSACGGRKSPDEMNVEELRKEIDKTNSQMRKLSSRLHILESALGEKDSSVGKEVFNVSIDTVRLSDFEHFVSIQGRVKSDKETSVSAETSGRVISLRVKEGDYVKKGALIAILDIEFLEAQINEARSQYELAIKLYNKQKALWDQNIGSEVQYLQAKNTKENLEKQLETLEVNRSKANVYATASGTVDRVDLEEGEYAPMGAPIVNLINRSTLKVVAQVPEVYVQNLKLGNEVKIEFPLLDTFQYTRLSRVGSVVNQTNRTIEVEAPIKVDEKRYIKPNMLAMMYIKDYERKQIIKVKSPLVQQEVSSRKYVLIAEKEGDGYKATKRYVKTGPYYNNQVLIEDGLKVGDLIIDSGARGISPGALLHVFSQKEEGKH